MLHSQFTMVVAVLHPEGIDTCRKYNGHDCLTHPIIERLQLFLPLAQPIRHSEHHKEEQQQVIRYIISVVVLIHKVKRQLCPQANGQVGFMIDVTIAEQRDEDDAQHSHHTVDCSLCLTRREPPRPYTHQQGSSEPIDAHQRIAQSTDGENCQRPQIILLRHTTEAPQ